MCCVTKPVQHQVVYQQQPVGSGGVMIVPAGANGGVVFMPAPHVTQYPEKGGAPPQYALYPPANPVGFSPGNATNTTVDSQPPPYPCPDGTTPS